jgi:NAD(P)-dependent dehydrogenase (short-subunit alcohol dehydrogenase family)
VYIATRSAVHRHAAIADLKDDTGKDSVFSLMLDLADLDSIKDAADKFLRKESMLHTLYNNE